ncbi:MAG: hypothetical protein LBQ15_11130 [Clostridium sp.]|jgi:hypothetical protein|nr:hypothetical protein [Clostridium sp.]
MTNQNETTIKEGNNMTYKAVANPALYHCGDTWLVVDEEWNIISKHISRKYAEQEAEQEAERLTNKWRERLNQMKEENNNETL